MAQNRDKKIQMELELLLAEHLPGIEVVVERSKRWRRMCVTLRWSGFEGLLPEERFERLTRLIPVAYRDAELAGFVWLELAPNEEIDGFLELPRSEDVADREPDIHTKLVALGFFDALARALGAEPKKSCTGGFSEVAAILSAKEFSKEEITDSKLVFIRHGAYCDCQALQTARAELAGLYAKADGA